MSENIRVALISGFVAIAASLISTYGVLASKKAELDFAAQTTNAAKLSTEGATKTANEATKAANIALAKLDEQTARLEKLTADSLRAKPDFDTGWIELPQKCGVFTKDLPKSGLPRIVIAYYRLKLSGETFLYGVNQYGDIHQTNGVLMDFDPEHSKLYIRLPCGDTNNPSNVVHLGWFTGRNGTPGQEILNRQDVQFQVTTWW